MSKSLGKLLTMKVLENSPTVLSLGKLCDVNECSYEWIHRQQPHHLKRDSDIMQLGDLRSFCGSRLVEFILQLSFFNFKKTPSKQESHCCTSSSIAPSSPTATASDNETREREHRIESDTTPVPV